MIFEAPAEPRPTPSRRRRQILEKEKSTALTHALLWGVQREEVSAGMSGQGTPGKRTSRPSDYRQNLSSGGTLGSEREEGTALV